MPPSWPPSPASQPRQATATVNDHRLTGRSPRSGGLSPAQLATSLARRRRVQHDAGSAAAVRLAAHAAVAAAAWAEARWPSLLPALGWRWASPTLPWMLLAVVVVNAAFLVYRWASVYFDPSVSLNETQMALLDIRRGDPGFKTTVEKEAKYPNPFAHSADGSLLLPAEASSSSWMLASPHSALNASSVNASPTSSPHDASTLASSSWLFRGPSPPRMAKGSPIVDEATLKDYLDDYEAWERHNNSGSYLRSSAAADTTAPSFWRPGLASPERSAITSGGGDSPLPDYSPVLRRLSYQLSTPMPGGGANDESKGGDSGRGAAGQGSSASGSHATGYGRVEEICYRAGVDQLRLVSWMENLRLWISQTVLVRLVAEVDKANAQLERLGLRDAAAVGESGLERVRRAAALPQVLGIGFMRYFHQYEGALHYVRFDIGRCWLALNRSKSCYLFWK
jgi:hypothetical protein